MSHQPRHAAPRPGVGSRLRGRALAFAAVPTALLMGAVYTPSIANAANSSSGKPCASVPDNTILSETPVPKDQLKAVPDQGAPTSVPSLPAQHSSTQQTTRTVQPATLQQPVAQQPTAQSGHTVQQADLIGDLLGGLLGGPRKPTPAPSPSDSASPSASPSKGAPANPLPLPGVPAVPSVPGVPLPSPSAGVPSVPGASGGASTTPTAATPSPAPSSTDPNCAVNTRSLAAKAASSGDVVPEQNWTLHSTKLALYGSVFNGVYDVRTPTGTRRVLKFTTDSVDIGDLDMSTLESNDKTFHVKGAPGSTSTMREGPVTMYVESLSGHLVSVEGIPIPIGIDITLTPDTLPEWLYNLIGAVPIPLNLTLTNAKAVQAGQFRGTLHIPGMHMYMDDQPYGQ